MPWQCLYFLPEPQGQGSLRPILSTRFTSGERLIIVCVVVLDILELRWRFGFFDLFLGTNFDGHQQTSDLDAYRL